jgi:hypothetical protein
LQLHDINSITGTTIGGHTYLKGGNFPCGLIRFDVLNNDSNANGFAFTIDLIPGSHRGYLCEKMGDM